MNYNPEKLIYIAAPYISDPEANTLNAQIVADALINHGYGVFIPHLFHYQNEKMPQPEQVWLKLDQLMLLRCDAVLRVSGYSRGADAEVELAKAHDIPVYYTLNGLKQFHNPNKQNHE